MQPDEEEHRRDHVEQARDARQWWRPVGDVDDALDVALRECRHDLPIETHDVGVEGNLQQQQADRHPGQNIGR